MIDTFHTRGKKIDLTIEADMVMISDICWHIHMTVRCGNYFTVHQPCISHLKDNVDCLLWLLWPARVLCGHSIHEFLCNWTSVRSLKSKRGSHDSGSLISCPCRCPAGQAKWSDCCGLCPQKSAVNLHHVLSSAVLVCAFLPYYK